MDLHRCLKCGAETLLPVEPLYSRETVCMLVPVKLTTLRAWMGRNKAQLDPPSYTGMRSRSRRLFTARDILTLRAALVRPKP